MKTQKTKRLYNTLADLVVAIVNPILNLIRNSEMRIGSPAARCCSLLLCWLITSGRKGNRLIASSNGQTAEKTISTRPRHISGQHQAPLNEKELSEEGTFMPRITSF